MIDLKMSPVEYAKLSVAKAQALRERWRVEDRATTPNGAPFPLRSWPPDAAIDIQHLAEWADPLRLGAMYICASVADRDTKIPTPVDGQMCYLKDTGTLQMHNGFVWVGDTTRRTPVGINNWNTAGCRYSMDFRARVTIAGNITTTNATDWWMCNLPTNYVPVPPAPSHPAHIEYSDGSLRLGSWIISGTSLAVASGGQTMSQMRVANISWVYQADFKAVR